MWFMIVRSPAYRARARAAGPGSDLSRLNDANPRMAARAWPGNKVVGRREIHVEADMSTDQHEHRPA